MSDVRAVSPTAIAVEALGLKLPDLKPSPRAAVCGLCGVPLVKGVTPAKSYQPPVGFGAAEHLHAQRDELICAACAVAVSADAGLMTRYSRALFTLEGAYRLSSAEDIGWMLQHAPAPFVAIFNTRSAAHMLWQAPVVHDRQLMAVMLGDRALTIRPKAVLDARDALSRLAEHGNERMKAHYQWPVFNLSLYDDVSNVCRLIPSHERVLRESEAPAVIADLRLFDDLTAGERWALSALLLARPKRDQPIDHFPVPPKLRHAGNMKATE